MKEKTFYKFVHLRDYLTHGDFPFFFFSLCIFLSTYSAPSSGGVVFGGLLHGVGVSVFFFFPSTHTRGLEGWRRIFTVRQNACIAIAALTDFGVLGTGGFYRVKHSPKRTEVYPYIYCTVHTILRMYVV